MLLELEQVLRDRDVLLLKFEVPLVCILPVNRVDLEHLVAHPGRDSIYRVIFASVDQPQSVEPEAVVQLFKEYFLLRQRFSQFLLEHRVGLSYG